MEGTQVYHGWGTIDTILAVNPLISHMDLVEQSARDADGPYMDTPSVECCIHVLKPRFRGHEGDGMVGDDALSQRFAGVSINT